MADPEHTPTPPPEPDVGVLVIGIAGAALSTAGILAAVVTLPVWLVLAASLFPVLFWALLLREIHKILRYNGRDDPEGAWLQGDAELWDGRVVPGKSGVQAELDSAPDADAAATESPATPA